MYVYKDIKLLEINSRFFRSNFISDLHRCIVCSITCQLSNSCASDAMYFREADIITKNRRIILVMLTVLLILSISTTTLFASTWGFGTYGNCKINRAYQGSELCKQAYAEGKAVQSYSCKFNVGFVAGSSMYGTPVTLSSVYQARTYGWISNSLNYDAFCHSYMTSDPSYYEYINFSIA